MTAAAAIPPPGATADPVPQTEPAPNLPAPPRAAEEARKRAPLSAPFLLMPFPFNSGQRALPGILAECHPDIAGRAVSVQQQQCVLLRRIRDLVQLLRRVIRVADRLLVDRYQYLA